MPDDDRDKRICVARIGAAHGVRGEVRLWSFTADPAALGRYGPFATADGRVIEIAALRLAKDCFVARLKGVDGRSAAEALRNVELFVPRDRLPPPDAADEYYHTDLIGLAAVDRAGRRLGTVVAMHNFGAGDLVELKLDGQAETRMLAFNADVVPHVDIAARRITVEMPAEIDADERAERPGSAGAGSKGA
jgi:16S rRNA processing protein RimM